VPHPTNNAPPTNTIGSEVNKGRRKRLRDYVEEIEESCRKLVEEVPEEVTPQPKEEVGDERLRKVVEELKKAAEEGGGKPEAKERVIYEKDGCKLIKRGFDYILRCGVGEEPLEVSSTSKVDEIKEKVRDKLKVLKTKGKVNEDLVSLTQELTDALVKDLEGVEGYVEALKSLVKERLEKINKTPIGGDKVRKDSLALYLALRVLDEVIPYYIESKDGRGGLIVVYDRGIYREGEDRILAVANEIATKEGLVEELTNQVRNNLISHVREMCLLAKEKHDLRKGKFLAFENGILDMDEFIETGELRLKPFDPNIFTLWKIPHELNVETYNALDPNARNDPVEALKKIDEEIYKAMCDWFDVDLKKLREENPDLEDDVEFAKVIYGMLGALDHDEKVVRKEGILKLLLQIAGNCLLPDVYFDFMTILYTRETMTAKSTYIEMVKSMLGWENTSSVPLQELAEDPYARIELYGKLANVYNDLPEGRIKNQGIIKSIVSGEAITANVKHRRRISFRPIAKHIYSCNKLPRPEDLKDKPYLRRILIIPFLRRFPRNEKFKKYLASKANKLLIPSLIALRGMLQNGLVLDPVNVVNEIQEFWMKKADPVYRFLTEMEKKEILKRERIGRIDDEDLLKLYNEWAEAVGEQPLDMRELTLALQRYRILKKGKSGKEYYEGIQLMKPLDEALKMISE